MAAVKRLSVLHHSEVYIFLFFKNFIFAGPQKVASLVQRKLDMSAVFSFVSAFIAPSGHSLSKLFTIFSHASTCVF